MPGNITDEEKLPKIPNLDAAQWKFYLKMHPNCTETQNKLLAEIKENGFLSFWVYFSQKNCQKYFYSFFSPISL